MKLPVEFARALHMQLTEGNVEGALALLADYKEWIPVMDYKLDGRDLQKVLRSMITPATQELEQYKLTPYEFFAKLTRWDQSNG